MSRARGCARALAAAARLRERSRAAGGGFSESKGGGDEAAAAIALAALHADGKWSCAACTCLNDRARTVCEACGASRAGAFMGCVCSLETLADGARAPVR